MPTLQEIREKLQAQEKRQVIRRNTGSFPFWNTPIDKTTRVRFLPDGNADNVFFWVEKQTILLPFPGVLKNNETKRVEVRVPCVEMWGETCSIIAETKPWWNDPKLEDLARRYWKKREYIFQGFVRDCPFSEDNVPENPIRSFAIRPQIFKNIKASLLDPDFDTMPTDYASGSDFLINKTMSGDGHAAYVTSTWARKESPLTDEEMEAIEKYGLIDLSETLPPRPTPDHLQAISEMFEASVDGELYDPSRWAQYYRPFGLQSNITEDPGTVVSVPANVKVAPARSPGEEAPAITLTAGDDTDAVPFDVAANTPAEDTPSDESAPNDVNAILDMIKQRQSQS